jgi:hypothetical protein
VLHCHALLLCHAVMCFAASRATNSPPSARQTARLTRQ